MSNYIVIGLGNFGAALALKLTEMGNDVIGVDNRMEKVDLYKSAMAHTICMNCTDPEAVKGLPFKNTDVVIVGIGEDEGANILVSALMKRMGVNRLISRAISPIQVTVLEAMGVDEIVHPEAEAADRLAKKLNIKGVVDSFELSHDYNIIEVKVPGKFVGKTLGELGLRKNYDIVVLTTMKLETQKGILGGTHSELRVKGVASADTKLEQEDILVVYGNIADIKRMLKDT
jgi:trk system potassium uptake protein TrkA